MNIFLNIVGWIVLGFALYVIYKEVKWFFGRNESRKLKKTFDVKPQCGKLIP